MENINTRLSTSPTHRGGQVYNCSFIDKQCYSDLRSCTDIIIYPVVRILEHATPRIGVTRISAVSFFLLVFAAAALFRCRPSDAPPRSDNDSCSLLLSISFRRCRPVSLQCFGDELRDKLITLLAREDFCWERLFIVDGTDVGNRGETIRLKIRKEWANPNGAFRQALKSAGRGGGLKTNVQPVSNHW